ncbi:hypothetical protein QTP86_029710 [Hemibagrus guttatus]|nr:hypothetical protein QTP86_029710 [Hemibagrus guttatus]
MEVSQQDPDHPPPPPPENGFVTPEAPSPGLMLSRVDGCVLPFLGGFGRYQKQLVVLTWIPALFIGFSQFSDNFLLAQTNSTCLRTINGTVVHKHVTTTAMTSAPVYTHAHHAAAGSNGSARAVEHCACENGTWRHEMLSGLKQNVVTKSHDPLIQTLCWNLVCDSAWKVHIAKFSLLVGSIFGYLVLGVLADWFGRHTVLVVSVFFTLVFGISVAFSVNVTMFSTLRFFEGFWLAGIALSLYVLRVELCLPGWRFSMTMVANFVVLAGQLLLPGFATVCSDWKILQAVIICPLSLMLSYIWLFPESLRWLLATQQYTRSKWLIERIAKKNNTNVDTHELITELNRVLEKPPKKTCIVKMVGTRNLWKNIVVLCVNSLTGYGIHHCFARSMMDQDQERITIFHNFYADYYTMAGIAVATGLALCPAVGIMGRRGGLLMFMIITALASLLQLGLLNYLEKAYDRVPREELWYCMRKSGVAEKYVRVVQDMYERSRTVVRCAVGQTEEFNVEVGLHQGSALSPFLFAIVMGQLSEEVRQESPWTMMFADGIVICSESREQVEENLERWRFALERRGMKVSGSKTEYMCVNEREGSGTVRLQGEEVKKVQEFKYLGSTVQSNGECGKEVKKRVQAGWNGWRKVSGVLCDRKISARIKGKVYRTVVRAAMLYGLETVSLRKRQESELEVAELKMLRFSLGVTRLDRIRNEYIRGTAHVGRLGDKVREARLRWFGHVQRREKSETLKSDFHVAFSIIGMFSSQAVSNLSIFFCAEITPTVIRGGGLGLVLASAGFGMLTAPIMELHNQKGYFLHHVIFACCTLICIICILLLPESRHQPLPESLSEGEGYTRHPLLPPHKKPAEQLHLLPGPHGRNYANDEHTNDRAKDFSKVRDTPLREVAVSTVESTASSTIAPDEDPGEEPADELNSVRLSVLRHHDNSIPTTNSLPDLIANASSPDASETPPSHQTSPSPEMLDHETPPIMDNDVTRSPEGVSVEDPELVTPPTTNLAPPALSFCPPPSISSPIDSDPLLSPPPQTGSTPSEPPSPAILDETVLRSLPLTVTDPVPPFKMDSTTSSPIDSAVDCTISTANGGASS